MQITTAAQSSQRDADAIASGVASWTLMLAAGSAAAQLIVDQYTDRLMYGAAVYAGQGNNGGDAYVVAARLVEAGARVMLVTAGDPHTPDAKRASALYDAALATRSKAGAFPSGSEPPRLESCRLVVDGVLGTGQRGALREAERAMCVAMNMLAGQAIVVSLDVPTGVNATTGEVAPDAVRATHTIAFGTMKRAHVLQRRHVGIVSVVDIGLEEHGGKNDGAWELADASHVGKLVPHIEWDAYKGTRGRVALVGGAVGMAGAIVLGSRAALRAGAGLVYAHTAASSMMALQVAVPQVVSRLWKAMPDSVHAVAVGPGLGRDSESRQTLNAILDATAGIPTVLDADALTLLATHDVDDSLDEALHDLAGADTTAVRLRQISLTRPVTITPHVGEFARLIDGKVAETLDGRIEQAAAFVQATGVVVLLKGTPTVIVSPDAPPIVVPRGNAVLATGGSGDVLTGLIGALLAQQLNPRDAATLAAFVHGGAAELARNNAGTVRGVTLDEVLLCLPDVWRELESPEALSAGVLARLPAI